MAMDADGNIIQTNTDIKEPAKLELTQDGVPVGLATQYCRAEDRAKAHGVPVRNIDRWYDEVMAKGQLPISTVIKEGTPFFKAIAEVHNVSGAKYPTYMWRENPGPIYGNCKDALVRHAMYITKGEHIDPESKVPHIYQLMCRIHMAFTCYVYLHGDCPDIGTWMDDGINDTKSEDRWEHHITWPTLGALTCCIRRNGDTLSGVKETLDARVNQCLTNQHIDSRNATAWLVNAGHNIFTSLMHLCQLSTDNTTYSDDVFDQLLRVFFQITAYLEVVFSVNPDVEGYPFSQTW